MYAWEILRLSLTLARIVCMGRHRDPNQRLAVVHVDVKGRDDLHRGGQGGRQERGVCGSVEIETTEAMWLGEWEGKDLRLIGGWGGNDGLLIGGSLDPGLNPNVNSTFDPYPDPNPDPDPNPNPSLLVGWDFGACGVVSDHGHYLGRAGRGKGRGRGIAIGAIAL